MLTSLSSPWFYSSVQCNEIKTPKIAILTIGKNIFNGSKEQLGILKKQRSYIPMQEKKLFKSL